MDQSIHLSLFKKNILKNQPNKKGPLCRGLFWGLLGDTCSRCCGGLTKIGCPLKYGPMGNSRDRLSTLENLASSRGNCLSIPIDAEQTAACAGWKELMTSQEIILGPLYLIVGTSGAEHQSLGLTHYNINQLKRASVRKVLMWKVQF